MKQIFLFTLIAFLISEISAQEKSRIKMSDFIGLNSNVASYDQKYLTDLARCAKWMREYHSWGHYEVADNYYKWDAITTYPQGYSWPDHNKFMDQCKALGINVLIDVLNKPDWAGTARGAYSTGDGSNPNDYLDKLEFMGQLVARYGAQKIDKSKLETADKISALNYIKYYEDDHEPDYWWDNPLWPAEKYAVWCNAVHDGFGVEPSDDYPLLGIKSVDSTAMHVLGGLAKNNVTYIQKILDHSNGRVPFDVINIHTYCTDDKDGYSPENESYGLEKNLGPFLSWCETKLPGMPVWLTEFGWDTYTNGTSGSYIYAPPGQQANYLLRSYFVALKMGFEKAFMFMDKDPNSKSTQQYSSSGLLTDQPSGLEKKPSYYYLATTQNILGNSALKQIHSYRKLTDSNEVYCFEFVNDKNESVFALWTRIKNSKTDNGTTLHYSLDLNYQPDYASVIKPKDKSLTGEKTNIEITGNSIPLTLSETPQFVIVAENTTSSIDHSKNLFRLNVYPNPTNNYTDISFQNPGFQKVDIKIFTSAGRLIETVSDVFLPEGEQHFRLEKKMSPGIYVVSVNASQFRETKKLVIQRN
jgi:hypothetical protein